MSIKRASRLPLQLRSQLQRQHLLRRQRQLQQHLLRHRPKRRSLLQVERNNFLIPTPL